MECDLHWSSGGFDGWLGFEISFLWELVFDHCFCLLTRFYE